MKRFIYLLSAVLMCISFCTQTAFAYTAGDPIYIEAGKLTDTTTGNQKTHTKTEVEETADNANRSIFNSTTEIAQKVINTIKLEQCPVYKFVDGRWVYVYDKVVSKQDIEDIAKLWVQFSDKGYDTKPNPSGQWKPNSVITNPNETILGVLDSIIKNDGIVAGSENKQTIYPSLEELLEFMQRYWYLIDGYGKEDIFFVRGDGHYIDGTISIVDFVTYKKRGEALQDVITRYYAGSDNVKIAYVVEYSLASETTSAVRSSKVKNWPGTQSTHFWEGECVSAPEDGYVRPPLQQFGTNEVTFTPNYAGEYRITATQIKENAYWDAVSYNKCEYLILKDTGQVIWKEETAGSVIKSSSPSNPLANQGLSQVHYYNHVSTETVYVTVWNETYNVSDRPIGSFVPPTAWKEDNKTVRIE